MDTHPNFCLLQKISVSKLENTTKVPSGRGQGATFPGGFRSVARVRRSASWGSPGPRCLVPVWLCAADAAIVWFASKLSSPAPDMSAPSRSFVHFFFTVHLLHPPPWPGQPPPLPLRWAGKLTGYLSNTTCCPYFISLNESNLIL